MIASGAVPHALKRRRDLLKIYVPIFRAGTDYVHLLYFTCDISIILPLLSCMSLFEKLLLHLKELYFAIIFIHIYNSIACLSFLSAYLSEGVFTNILCMPLTFHTYYFLFVHPLVHIINLLLYSCLLLPVRCCCT